MHHGRSIFDLNRERLGGNKKFPAYIGIVDQGTVRIAHGLKKP